MSDSRCIYCLLSGGPFNRDHVIPEALGKFVGNFVLHDAVCQQCNSYFGDNLELPLGRGSLDALLRLQYGVKDQKHAKTLQFRRIDMRISEPGPWRGARVILRPDSASGTALKVFPLSQVAFKRKLSIEWDWYVEPALTVAVVGSYDDPATEIKIIGPSDGEISRLTGRLKSLGMDLQSPRTIDRPSSETVETQALHCVDEIILRSAGKIALNYLATVKGAGFVLSPDFNEVRRYVRYGERPGNPVVVPTREPVLMDDLPNARQTNGHLVTLDWDQWNHGLTGQVCLFNVINYRVRLCAFFSSVWHNLRVGHHFDIRKRTIQQLGSTTLGWNSGRPR